VCPENIEIDASWHVERAKWGKQCRKKTLLAAHGITYMWRITMGKFVAKKINGIGFETTDVLVKCWG